MVIKEIYRETYDLLKFHFTLFIMLPIFSIIRGMTGLDAPDQITYFLAFDAPDIEPHLPTLPI